MSVNLDIDIFEEVFSSPGEGGGVGSGGNSPSLCSYPTFLSGQNAKKGMFACQPGSVGAREQLQNTQPLIYKSLNKNSVYCVMP